MIRSVIDEVALEGEYANDPAIGTEHAKRIYKICKRIAKEAGDPPLDEDVLYAACMLHDIVPEDPHEEKSWKWAKQKLEEKGVFSPKQMKILRDAILHHHDRGAQTLEGKLLHDAEIVDFLGATGVATLSMLARDWFEATSLKDLIPVVKHMRNKKREFLLPETRKLVKNKLVVTDLFLRQLDKELREGVD